MKGCLGWACAIIGWFVLWGTCMAIGDANHISPFFVLFLIILGIVIIGVIALLIGVIALLISSHITAMAELKLESQRDLCRSIQKKYPNAYRDFCYKNNIRTYGELSKEDVEKILVISDRDWDCQEKDCLEKQRISREQLAKANEIKNAYPRGYEIWSKDKKHIPSALIINPKKEIAKVDSLYRTAEMYDKWEKSQESFNDICYELSKKHMSNYGRYYYDLDWEKQNEKGDVVSGKYRVWQFFADSLCLDESLDYTNCQSEKESYIQLPEFKECTRHFYDRMYDKVLAFIDALSESSNNSLCVVINDEIDGWSQDAFDYHYKYIKAKLEENNIKAYNLSCLLDQVIVKSESIPSTERVFIFDIYTENADLLSNCGLLLGIFGNGTLISYITMLKCYDSSEMQELITEANEKELKKKKLLEEKLAKQKEEREAKKVLKGKVKEWHSIQGVLRYNYLLNYYPTTCEFEASDEEWDDRWTVWDFKNTPGKTDEEDHQDVLDDVIPRIKATLVSTFGKSSLKYLTLVCIPASSPEKPEARYKEFSERLCKETGMENAYDYMTVNGTSEEKKFGCRGITTKKVTFDEEFFKDKYVLLFDDVITKGESMLRFKLKMEKLGANVVCGFSIGKTKHERI